MNTESFLKQRLLCIAVVDDPEAAMPLAEALLAGGLKNMEIPFRTAAAAESIRRIRQELPEMAIGAGTLLTVEQVQQAMDAGAQFGVAPGLNEAVLQAAEERHLPFFPGVMTPRKWIVRCISAGST